MQNKREIETVSNRLSMTNKTTANKNAKKSIPPENAKHKVTEEKNSHLAKNSGKSPLKKPKLLKDDTPKQKKEKDGQDEVNIDDNNSVSPQIILTSNFETNLFYIFQSDQKFLRTNRCG